jgi:predicted RNase H-like HicB family nuclease
MGRSRERCDMGKGLKFNLLENAIDSLQQGIAFALKDSPTQSDLKLSVLLVAQSVELLLKERLKREHWSLIFSKIEQVGNINANTVTVDEAIKRLEQIAHVKLDEEERETISLLSNIRNKIQHYEIEITFEEVLGKNHAAIAFITRFLKDEFDKDIRDYFKQDDVGKLISMDEALEHFQELAQQNIEKLKKENEPSRHKDQMYWQFEIITCPECWQDYYVFSPDSDISQCQLCKYEGSFVKCERCGFQAPSGSMEFHSEHEGFAICNSCWEDIEDE